MGKRLILILALVLAVGLTSQAYAEVQNIKVGGDIAVHGVSRRNFNLSKGSVGNKHDDVQTNLQSAVRLRIDAELTENVSAVVQLLNEREWSAETNASTDIDLDLAYIKLREFLYSPLTLVIGRQNLRYGNGFIIGDPYTNQFSKFGPGGAAVIVAQDLSVRKSFDAIRAILDYDPLVIDLIYAKINEGTVLGTTSVPESDDVNLYGVNVAYDFGGEKNVKGEMYTFTKHASQDGVGVNPMSSTKVTSADRTITIGGKVSMNPMERMMLSAEMAGQTGKMAVSAGDRRSRSAMAYQLIGIYALDMKYSPVVTTSFTHFSGNKDTDLSDGGKQKAWDPMFEDQSGGKIYNALFSNSNCNVAEIKLALSPMEDLIVSLEYTYLWLAKKIEASGFTSWAANDYATYIVVPGKDKLGNEFGLVLTYDYTEDVQLGLNAGLFRPGSMFSKSNRSSASQLIASVKVAF